jgi:hypothetical protein
MIMQRLLTFEEAGMSPFAYKEYVMTHANSELEKAYALSSMFKALELIRRRLIKTHSVDNLNICVIVGDSLL